MSEYVIQGQTLTGIADAIRAQLGTEQQYTPESMATEIRSIQGGGGDDLAKAVITKTVADIDLTYDVGPYAFYACDRINPHFLEGCTRIGSYAFQNCGHIEQVSAPYVVTVDGNAFMGVNSLKWVNLPVAESIGTGCFNNCRSLVALIVSTPTLCTLSSVSALSGTPIASGTGYIYVPDDLVEQYKVATNWATYAAQIKGLSEIPADVQQWLDQQGGASA